MRRFRWVYCHIETLRRCFPASIRLTLDELPETLDGTYEQTLRAIDKQKRDYAYRLFQCLVVSKRPLRVEELGELFAIQPNAETIPAFDAFLRPENAEEFVLLACSTLVTVVNVDDQKFVQFSHFSVREYLISHRIAISEHVSHFHVRPRSAHALLARACLGVLLQLDDHINWGNIQNFPLAWYAAQYWVDHAQFENVSSDIQHGIECFFDRNKPHFAAWRRLYDIEHPVFPSLNPQPYPVPLYYAALCGFHDIAKHLVDTYPQDINPRGGKRVTPLHAASDKGHLSVAMLLVERGADMESRDSRNRTPLHIASYRGHAEVASFLIDRGADINAEEISQMTPLHLASERGHDKVVRLLLCDHGADVTRSDSLLTGRTPLYLASERGHDDIVQLLLDNGAIANQKHFLGMTPLHIASERGYADIVQLLLDYGAVANHPYSLCLTPLHHASLRGHSDTVQLLLNRGAVVDPPNRRGLTPLHLASQEGHNDVVRLLLDHGAFANHPDKHGRTPLHLALEAGHDDTFQLLLDHGAVADHPDNPS